VKVDANHVNDFRIRSGTLTDVPEILRQRRGMYHDMGHTDPAGLDAMVTSSEPYLRSAMADGTLHSWLATAQDGRVLGGGVVIITPRLSRPHFPRCHEVSILNVYVYPEYRRRGIARALMQSMIDWCHETGYNYVSLHSSDDGRALYESLGFEPTGELRLKLR
jgi:GNAT superfamily N-acetyltransferase